jgi:hypothetical protein
VHQVIDQTRSHILCLMTLSESRAAYEIMCKTDVNIIRRMRSACRITKATDANSKYVILIVFPRQQWLRTFPVLSYQYIQSAKICREQTQKPSHAYFLSMIVFTLVFQCKASIYMDHVMLCDVIYLYSINSS